MSALDDVRSILDPNPATVEQILAGDPKAVVGLKRTEPTRPNYTDPDHYRRVTHVVFTPPDYDDLQARLDLLAVDDDDRGKYGTGFDA